MRRLTLLAAVAFLAGCGSSRAIYHPPGKVTVNVALGSHHVFPSGALREGDVVVCGGMHGKPGAGAAVQPRRHGVSSSGGIELQTHNDGSVEVRCDKQVNPI